MAVERVGPRSRNIYQSRGRRNRAVLTWTLASFGVLSAATLGGLYVATHVNGRSGRETAAARVALVAPSPKPLRNLTVHEKQRVTLSFRVADRGAALRSVSIVIRKANGTVAKDLRLGPQPPDRPLGHRFRVTLKAGHYRWFVRATGADGLTRTSVHSARLEVLPPLPRLFPDASAIARALAWAAGRTSRVGVAIVDSHGLLHAYDARGQFQSASLSKAMLLVAYLRRYPRPTSAMRATLTSMIEESDDAAADRVFGAVGNSGLQRVAKLAGMREFDVGTSWIDARVAAADQARFFFSYESYLPKRSVAFARALLSGITPIQRWGIPAAAGPAGWEVFFKGGWMDADNDKVTQAAWLERGDVRWSLAILTADDPTSSYGWQTQKGITGLLLGQEPTAAYLAVVHEGDAEEAP